MSIRRARRTKSLAAQTVELGVVVPQVVAHRVARMAMAGTSPSARDRKEFQRMRLEKIAAFNESWNAMAVETLLANQRLALSAMQAFWFPWVRSKPASNPLTGILAKGLNPVRRRASANAKRLGRIRRR